MCKRPSKEYRRENAAGHWQQREQQLAGGPYEGKTIRLNEQPERGRPKAHSFPCWALWLIWPLIVLIKAAAPLAAEIATALQQLPALSYWPLVLVGLGLLLVARR